MKIIITRSVFMRGMLVEASTQPVDLPEADAKQLLAMGKAVQAPDEPAPVAVETPAPEPVASAESAPVDASSTTDKPKKK